MLAEPATQRTASTNEVIYNHETLYLVLVKDPRGSLYACNAFLRESVRAGIGLRKCRRTLAIGFNVCDDKVATQNLALAAGVIYSDMGVSAGLSVKSTKRITD